MARIVVFTGAQIRALGDLKEVAQAERVVVVDKPDYSSLYVELEGTEIRPSEYLIDPDGEVTKY